MNLKQRITCLDRLGKWIETKEEDLKAVVAKTYIHNKWFTPENIYQALDGITAQFLQREKLETWCAKEGISEIVAEPKNVGLILAGNIPAVGFHDWLCVILSGHVPLVKLSEKDKFLLPLFDKYLNDIGFQTKTEFVERMKGLDAVIATGSNNTARYFESYFGKYPNIIRKNRNAVAIINGKETKEELMALGKDVFSYFGLGCRSISKVYVPTDYNFDAMLESFQPFESLTHHNKYKNNFDYNYTLIILNKVKHLSLGTILLVEDEALTSRIATLHYERYEDVNEVAATLNQRKEEIQCVTSKENIENLATIPFGAAQQPALDDYADGVNVMNFLTSL